MTAAAAIAEKSKENASSSKHRDVKSDAKSKIRDVKAESASKVQDVKAESKSKSRDPQRKSSSKGVGQVATKDKLRAAKPESREKSRDAQAKSLGKSQEVVSESRAKQKDVQSVSRNRHTEASKAESKDRHREGKDKERNTIRDQKSEARQKDVKQDSKNKLVAERRHDTKSNAKQTGHEKSERSRQKSEINAQLPKKLVVPKANLQRPTQSSQLAARPSVENPRHFLYAPKETVNALSTSSNKPGIKTNPSRALSARSTNRMISEPIANSRATTTDTVTGPSRQTSRNTKPPQASPPAESVSIFDFTHVNLENDYAVRTHRTLLDLSKLETEKKIRTIDGHIEELMRAREKLRDHLTARDEVERNFERACREANPDRYGVEEPQEVLVQAIVVPLEEHEREVLSRSDNSVTIGFAGDDDHVGEYEELNSRADQGDDGIAGDASDCSREDDSDGEDTISVNSCPVSDTDKAIADAEQMLTQMAADPFALRSIGNAYHDNALYNAHATSLYVNSDKDGDRYVHPDGLTPAQTATSSERSSVVTGDDYQPSRNASDIVEVVQHTDTEEDYTDYPPSSERQNALVSDFMSDFKSDFVEAGSLKPTEDVAST